MPNPIELSRRLVLGAAAAAVVLGGVAAVGPALALATGFTAYTKDAFDAALKGPKPVLVHVHADWCPVCVRQEAVFNELSGSEDYKKLTAFMVDFDMDTDFRKTYGVNYQSVILAFKGGKEIARLNGVTDKVKIAEFMAAAVK